MLAFGVRGVCYGLVVSDLSLLGFNMMLVVGFPCAYSRFARCLPFACLSLSSCLPIVPLLIAICFRDVILVCVRASCVVGVHCCVLQAVCDVQRYQTNFYGMSRVKA